MMKVPVAALLFLARLAYVVSATKFRVTVQIAANKTWVVPVSEEAKIYELIESITYRHNAMGNLNPHDDGKIELQIDGCTLDESDNIIDVVQTNDVVDVLWLHHGVDSTVTSRSYCTGKTGCPSCVEEENCYWCSVNHKCLSSTETHLCPLQAPRQTCSDFNLKEDRRQFLRPCFRLPSAYKIADGICCGDAICDGSNEDFENCKWDCTVDDLPYAEKQLTPKQLPATSHTKLFGLLSTLVHDTYHCEDTYHWKDGSPCSRETFKVRNRPSRWLDSLLDRVKRKTMPFAFPKPVKEMVVVELGCGLGQDTRNMLTAGFGAVVGIDVSPVAIDKARQFTHNYTDEWITPTIGNRKKLLERINYIAYDALALPRPKIDVDFVVDFTVYCGLRHRYLSRLYDMWKRVLIPGRSLLMIQCWKSTTNAPVTVSLQDMKLDFEPIFDVLFFESCEKNQLLGGKVGAWCFYLRLQPVEEIDTLWGNRTALYKDIRARKWPLSKAATSALDAYQKSTRKGRKHLWSAILQESHRAKHEKLVNYLLDEADD